MLFSAEGLSVLYIDTYLSTFVSYLLPLIALFLLMLIQF